MIWVKGEPHPRVPRAAYLLEETTFLATSYRIAVSVEFVAKQTNVWRRTALWHIGIIKP